MGLSVFFGQHVEFKYSTLLYHYHSVTVFTESQLLQLKIAVFGYRIIIINKVIFLI